ncbi:hypothetical protein Tco_1403851 [Tanacetum coccineum]
MSDNGRYYDCLFAGQVLTIRYRNSRLDNASIIFDRRWQGTTTSEGEIGGGPVSAIEGQLQKTVDADATGNSKNVAIWKSSSDRRGRSVSRGTSFDLTRAQSDEYEGGGRSVDCAGNTVKAEMDEGQKAYKGVSTTAAVAVVSGAQQLISSHGHGAKTILIYRPVKGKEIIFTRFKSDFPIFETVVDLTEDDDDEDIEEIPDVYVSFIVNIFPDGYTIDKSLKSHAAQQIASMYDPKLLRPYDRASQSLFTAIKCCRVPANFFEDIPCTYKNGKVACEVRDWRKDSSEQAGVCINGPPSIAATPSIRRISLRMSVDSIVRDIPQMSKRDFWAYSELLEAEAKILLALYPKLDLDSYPNFDRLCKKPTIVKLNLDFRAMRRKRLRKMSVPEKSNLGTDQPNVANPATQNVGTAFNALRASNTRSMSLPSANDGRRFFVSAFDGRTVNQDGQSSFPMAFLDGRRSRSNSLVFLGNQQQQQYDNAARTSANAPGASSSHGMRNLNSNNSGISSSSLVNMDNRNWSNPLADVVNQHQLIPLHNQNTSRTTAFSAPGASSTHDMISLNSNKDGISSIIPFDDGKMGNQDGRLSSVANLDNRNQSNPLVYVGYQQPKLDPHMPDHAQRTAFGVPGASSTHSMIDLTSNNDDLSSILFGLDGKSGNQDGQSSFMAIADNRNQSNPLAIVGNQQQQR